METPTDSEARPILAVPRGKAEARQFYDRISRIYGFLTAAFERKHAERALVYLCIEEGEAVLEIGFGSGHCLQLIANSVGQTGLAHGVDLSSGMLSVARTRLSKEKALDRVDLSRADAANLPYRSDSFDAAFMAFTLELFDTPEIPIVLQELRRVVKPKGRIGVVSMSKEDGESAMVRLYEWVHQRWPKYADCRPIYVERSLTDAGYRVQSKSKASMAGLPLEIVVAENTTG
jgi:ubiquinone/menaquinone biosynthesis C-methylase UbiE